ncbi:MAG: prepilin peptidase [Clostridia bacterium]|nr:prepilin peptidase [Clostridia bacterium]
MNIIFINHIAVVLLVILSLVCDIKTCKIKNGIVFPFILLGVAVNSMTGGFSGALRAFAGIMLPITLLIVFFLLRMLGAGDIKLFSALGAILGLKPVLYIMVYSFLCGGIIALILILIRKNGIQRLIHLLKYIKVSILTFSLLPYNEFGNKSDGSLFRFSYAVACGTLVFYIMAFYGQVSDFFRF